MINVHIYPSPFTHESRILRETAALAPLQSFGKIWLVGIGAPGLAPRQQIDGKREIRRFPRPDGTGLAGKALATARWSRGVLAALGNESISCVNCHSLPVLPLCARLARRTGAKLIYDAHELETETNGLRGVRKLLSKIVERHLVHRADAVVVVSEGIRQWYAERYGVQPTVVLNCPDFVAVHRSDVLRERLGIDAAQRMFLYQGLLSPGRGIEILCAAFESLPEPRPALVFMGDGPLRDFILGRRSANRNIHHLPAVPPGEVARYTCSADVGLCLFQNTSLSHYYVMPNKLFEYIHAGIPVICSDLPELRRVLGEHRIGELTPSDDPVRLAAAMQSMLTQGREPFAAGLRSAAAAYNWQAQVRTLRELYARLGFN